MPEIKIDRSRDRRQWQAIGLIALPSLLVLVYGLANGSIPILGFVLGFIATMAGIAWWIRAVYFYRCPQCGQRLPYRGGPRPGAKIFYHCHRCDVLWDTGQQEDFDPDAPPAARPPSPDLLGRIEQLLLQSRSVEAVKLWRSECGGTLSEAVFRIREIEDRLRALSLEKFIGRQGR